MHVAVCNIIIFAYNIAMYVLSTHVLDHRPSLEGH